MKISEEAYIAAYSMARDGRILTQNAERLFRKIVGIGATETPNEFISHRIEVIDFSIEPLVVVRVHSQEIGAAFTQVLSRTPPHSVPVHVGKLSFYFMADGANQTILDVFIDTDQRCSLSPYDHNSNFDDRQFVLGVVARLLIFAQQRVATVPYPVPV